MPVRAATRVDAAAIAAMEQQAAQRPWGLDDVTRHLEAPTGCGFVAVGHTAVHGHVLASVVGDEAEVFTVAVCPTARRRGVGRQLLQALVRHWSESGVRTAWLEVRTDNLGARALYAADGWVEAGRRKAYYHDGVDALVLRREVP